MMIVLRRPARPRASWALISGDFCASRGRQHRRSVCHRTETRLSSSSAPMPAPGELLRILRLRLCRFVGRQIGTSVLKSMDTGCQERWRTFLRRTVRGGRTDAGQPSLRSIEGLSGPGNSADLRSSGMSHLYRTLHTAPPHDRCGARCISERAC